jgi:hypothetical protein
MRSLLLAALLTLAGCASDSATAPVSTIEGSWTLRTIDGSPLPFVVAQAAQFKLELVSDVVILSSNGSVIRTTSIRSTTNGQANAESIRDTGRYTLAGTAVVVRFDTQGVAGAGSWSGNTMTLTDDEGVVFVYYR